MKRWLTGLVSMMILITGLAPMNFDELPPDPEPCIVYICLPDPNFPNY